MNRIIALTLLAVAMLALSSCQFLLGTGRLQRFDGTETHRPHYAFEWPADASRETWHYHTVEQDGRMITTVPIVEVETRY